MRVHRCRLFVVLFILGFVLNGCTSSEATDYRKEQQSVLDNSDENASFPMTDAYETPAIECLRFETAALSGLGNSISNLRNWGLIAGDDCQLYTVEYWARDSEEKRMGIQIYVEDSSGKRCLTNENVVIGYLNLTESALYYVNDRGISMIDRKSEAVEQVVSMEDVSFLLSVEDTLYFTVFENLYSYDLKNDRMKKISSEVMPGYLDFEAGRLYFCKEIDERNRKASLCVVNGDGSVENYYTYDASQVGLLKLLDESTLICCFRGKENPDGSTQNDLGLLDLNNNEQRVLVSDYSPNTFVQNGDQLIAGAGRGPNAYWLVDINRKTIQKIPDWGSGVLNFTSDRLFAVDFVSVSHQELSVVNDQFHAEPLP